VVVCAAWSVVCEPIGIVIHRVRVIRKKRRM
jgi:hypothetical protein